MESTKCRYGTGGQQLCQNPLAKLHGPFLMAGGAKISPFTREGQGPFRPARVASNSGKTLMEVTTGQVAGN